MKNIIVAFVFIMSSTIQLSANDGNGFWPNGTFPYAATGSSVTIAPSDRAAAHLTVEDFGAKGDCATDDTAAFNSYSSYLRGRTGYGIYREYNIGVDRCYKLAGSVNMTGLAYTVVEGHGSRLIGSVSGKAIIDAVQSTHMRFQNMSIISSGAPLVGLQIGRPLNGFSGAESISLQNIFIDGAYTRAALYNRAAETSVFINVEAKNRYNSTSAYAIVNDGCAYYPIVSDFASTYNPSDPTVADELTTSSSISFNENMFIEGTYSSQYGSPIWMCNTRGHRYLDPYMSAAAGRPAAILYFRSNDALADLMWHVHSEPYTISSDLMFSGTMSNPVMMGLDYKNHIDMTSGSVFSRDTGVSAVTIQDLRLRIPALYDSSKTVFDNPAAWTVSGTAFTPFVGTFNINAFQGTNDVGGNVTTYGALAPTIALPSNLNVSSVSSSGSVSGITITGNNNSYPGGTTPSVSIAPPPSGGSQATAVVSNVGAFSVPLPTTSFGGTTSGYTNGDIVTLSAGCSSAIRYVLTVSGGVVSSIALNNTVGNCPVATLLNNAIATTGGTGSGLTIDGTKLYWRIIGASITGPGSGYTTIPAVTFSVGNVSASTGVATLTSSLALNSGAGSILMNSSGTLTGIAGSGGAATISLGALVDNSSTATVALTTSGYTIPANVSRQAFKPSATLASATITLPTPTQANFVLTLPFYNFGVTALTFSPAVTGWTNGSAISPDSAALKLGYDLASGTWHREQ